MVRRMNEGTQPGQPYHQPPPQPGQQPPPQQPGYQQPGFQPPPQQPGFQPPPQQQPGQYPQQPYYQPPPGAGVPPKKGGSKALKVILILFAVCTLLIGGCIGTVFLLARGPIDRTNNFLGAVQSEDWQTAFDLTNRSCGIADTPAELAQNFDGFTISSYSILSVFNENGIVRTEGTVVLNGTTRAAQFIHRDELICSFDIAPG